MLGGPLPPVKSDADAVRLSADETEYSLELERERDDTVVTASKCYSGAEDLCELFVALTETNRSAERSSPVATSTTP